MSQKIGKRNSVIYGAITSLFVGIMMVVIAFMFNNAPYLTSISMILFSGGSNLYPVVFARSMEILPHLRGGLPSTIMGMRMILLTGFITFLAISMTPLCFRLH